MSVKNLLGWREWVALPDLGIEMIKAKVDTGARTSALHAYFVEPYQKYQRQYVRFGVHPTQGNSQTQIICDTEVLDQRQVTDSGGHRELRYTITTTVTIGQISKKIVLTLTNRDNMKFRMLLGRTAIAGEFYVDASTSFLSGKPLTSSSSSTIQKI